MAQTRQSSASPGPVGEAASNAARRRAKNPAYAAEAARIAPYEAVARLVVKYRLENDLTQKELADRIGTSHSAISRLESGHAAVSLKTMQRVAEALGARLVLGFEAETDDHELVRELVTV
jgi:ribosome-binding protein aMBF1 (putative translation factor)